MEQLKLEKLIYQNYSHNQISEELNISKSMVSYWLKKYSLKTNIVATKDMYSHLSDEEKLISKKQRNSDKVSKRRKIVRQKAIDLLGGKCIDCGYDKYNEVLEFHHIDPSTKSFGLTINKMGQKWNVIETEALKCKLLCANCHREEHIKLKNNK